MATSYRRSGASASAKKNMRKGPSKSTTGKTRKNMPRRSSSAPRRRTTSGVLSSVGLGMQAAGANASRLGALTAAPQARLALAGGGVALNTLGRVVQSMDRPVRTFSPNRARASKIKVERKIARKRRNPNTTRGR